MVGPSDFALFADVELLSLELLPEASTAKAALPSAAIGLEQGDITDHASDQDSLPCSGWYSGNLQYMLYGYGLHS